MRKEGMGGNLKGKGDVISIRGQVMEYLYFRTFPSMRSVMIMMMMMLIIIKYATYVSSLCLCNKLSFPPFFDLKLPPLAPKFSFLSQIIKELCSSSVICPSMTS